jgi:hypothetical protein
MKNLTIDELKKKWRAENCSYTPALASEIHDFERRRKIVFPEDFERYLLEVNGTKVDGDPNLFEFYPLDRLETWNEKKWTIPPRTPNYFAASEFLCLLRLHDLVLGVRDSSRRGPRLRRDNSVRLVGIYENR